MHLDKFIFEFTKCPHSIRKYHFPIVAVMFAGDWKKMAEFDRLLLFRALRPDRLVAAMEHFVTNTLGKDYSMSLPYNLEATLQVLCRKLQQICLNNDKWKIFVISQRIVFHGVVANTLCACLMTYGHFILVSQPYGIPITIYQLRNKLYHLAWW